MKKFLAVATLCALSACEGGDDKHITRALAEKTFTTRIYNYTHYDLYSIAYKDASLPFDVGNAADGGSVFFRNASTRDMDDGSQVSYGSDTCCLIWNKPTDKPLRVRVVWSVVHDLDAFDGPSSKGSDERSYRRAGPGNRWCEAIVDIAPAPRSVLPDTVIFHFFADGSVQAQLGTHTTGLPLPSAQVRKQAGKLPIGEFCKREIDNPYYGIPRAPHSE